MHRNEWEVVCVSVLQRYDTNEGENSVSRFALANELTDHAHTYVRTVTFKE